MLGIISENSLGDFFVRFKNIADKKFYLRCLIIEYKALKSLKN